MTLIADLPSGLAGSAARVGDATTVLDDAQITSFVTDRLGAHAFDGRSVCVLVPDATRSCPLPLLMRAVHGALHGRVTRLTVVVALGMQARGYPDVRANTVAAAALIPSEKLALCVVTAEVADAAVDSAVDGAVPVPAGRGSALHSVSFGDSRASWASAAEVCAATHVTYLDAPVRRVLPLVPEMYDEIWAAAKGFYKLEPVVADGGEVILYALHVTEISTTHPEIHEIGYHCRDYFMAQWDRFSHVPWGVLAHSTHLRGAGTYDAATGEERLRVQVTLATGIPEELCRAANLGYLDPATVDPAAFAAEPGTLVVPRAGEMLYRLREVTATGAPAVPPDGREGDERSR
jgi:hypothetical protein